jgi:hypothetical protein
MTASSTAATLLRDARPVGRRHQRMDGRGLDADCDLPHLLRIGCRSGKEACVGYRIAVGTLDTAVLNHIASSVRTRSSSRLGPTWPSP